MNAKDQVKVLNAGFMLIRSEIPASVGSFLGKIKCKTIQRREWHTLETGFISKASMDRRIAELLKSDKVVED